LLDVTHAKALPLDILMSEGVQWPPIVPFLYQGRLHWMGAPVAADTPVMDRRALSRWAMVAAGGSDRAGDERSVAGDFDQFRKTGRIAPKVVSPARRGRRPGPRSVAGSTRIRQGRRPWPRGFGQWPIRRSLWRDVVPERQTRRIEDGVGRVSLQSRIANA
jgi:hypothetical protein